MRTTTSPVRLGEPTFFELIERLALDAAPGQLALAGIFQVAAAATVAIVLPAQWWCAMPMLAFAATSAWGLAARAGRDATGMRAELLAAVRVLAAGTGLAAALAFALGFFLGALGTSWIS